jgi:hypothetical protein
MVEQPHLADVPEDVIKLIDHLSDAEWVYPIAQSAINAQLPIARARKALRWLRAHGFAEYGTLWNEDEGHPAGSGTWLTASGLSLQTRVRDAFLGAES